MTNDINLIDRIEDDFDPGSITLRGTFNKEWDPCPICNKCNAPVVFGYVDNPKQYWEGCMECCVSILRNFPVVSKKLAVLEAKLEELSSKIRTRD